jgi:hypothetical protein
LESALNCSKDQYGNKAYNFVYNEASSFGGASSIVNHSGMKTEHSGSANFSNQTPGEDPNTSSGGKKPLLNARR